MTDAEYEQLVRPTKRCTRCGKVKAEDEFQETKQRGKLVRRSWCTECMKGYWKRRNQRAKWRRELGTAKNITKQSLLSAHSAIEKRTPMGETKIEWCDHTINPVRARDQATNKVGHYCEKISAGCANCYASGLQRRFGTPSFPGAGKPMAENIRPFLDESKLQEVLRRKKPTRIFWCDMTDLFGHWIPDEWIDRCFATMALTPHHSHQVLTKRPERMREYLSHYMPGRVCDAAGRLGHKLVTTEIKEHSDGAYSKLTGPQYPFPNVWLGVSVENQAAADERIPLLLQTPAAVRFLSVEPLLGPVDLSPWLDCHCPGDGSHCIRCLTGGPDWIIVGGESGTGARECRLPWIRSLVQQCRAAGVACFVKQLGSNFHSDGEVWPDAPRHVLTSHRNGMIQNTTELSRFGNGRWKLRDRKGGYMGEWPEDIRVREFPGEAQDQD